MAETKPNVVNNQRIAKNTFLLYMRTMLTMVISLYTSRVILQILGVEDYGIYNVVGGFVTLMSFVSGAMSTSTSRYITFALGKCDDKYIKDVFSTALLAHLLIVGVIVFFGETVGLWFVLNKLVIPEGRMTAAIVAYQVGLLSMVVYMWSIPYNACIIAHEQMSAFAYISIYEAVSKLLIVFLFVYIPIDRLISYSILLFTIQLSVRFIYSWYCRKHFEESKFTFLWDKRLLKEMISFAGWNLWGSASYALFTQGVNILLNMFFCPVVNAARGIAVQVQSAVSIFASNFQTAINPQITKTYANSEIDAMHSLIFRSSKFSFFLLFCLSLPIIIESEFILSLWLKTVPNYTAIFLQLMLCICIIDAMSNPLMTAAAATGKVKLYQSVIGTIVVMIFPISYVALKLGGNPESVFYVHIAVAIIATVVRLFLIRHMIKLSISSFIRKCIIPCIMVASVSFVSMRLLKNALPYTVATSCAMIGISIIVVCVTFFFMGMTTGERHFIYGRIKTVVSRIKK
ncbi:MULTISPECIES: oligosaccharide flippase family protein [unclassified Bacteroides]|uniref:oligosaccharide flippase family protein n=1 Tax=unclassified Bacteroides TaxID=2646097 RepID=UPI0004E1ACC0|nr:MULTISPECIES: oligosaccharide flippase family protein [unclassified Bacteroides]